MLNQLKKNQYILLAGATGYIGSYVLKRLKELGYKVVCPVRKYPKNNVQDKSSFYIQAEILDYDNLKKSVFSKYPISAVISCIGSRNGNPKDSWDVDFEANNQLLKLSLEVGVANFVLLSAICVQKPKLEFQFAKLAFENQLKASGLCYSIVRPTAFFKSLAGQIENILAGKSFVVFDDGKKTACKPISGDDLAKFICDCLDKEGQQNQILPIGGPGPAITQLEQGKMLFRILKKKQKFKRVPSYIFKVLIVSIAPFAIFFKKAMNLKEFLKIGHYYATESMLVWDDEANSFFTEKTPETGAETLEQFYCQILKDGLEKHKLGEHKLF